MLESNILNNKAARSIFYILFIGGLLSLSSIMIMYLWDFGLIKLFNVHNISFLESVGIVSIVYVIYFGIKFGENSCADKKAAIKPLSHSSANLTVNKDDKLFHDLTDIEKEELKEFVSQCCGLPSKAHPYLKNQVK